MIPGIIHKEIEIMENTQKPGTIKISQLKILRDDFLGNGGLKVAMNAVTRGSLTDIALNRDIINSNNWAFSHEIEEKAEITDQKKSGTCWLFAEFNWLRTITMKKFRMGNLEFSQNYLMFYDKLEKANFYLEELIKRLDLDIDDRYIRFILDRPARDGGEWHMLVNLLNKYGIVPKEIMPDTYNRENSRHINELISFKIREAYAYMRKLFLSNKKDSIIRQYKEKIMSDIFKILAVCMGIPPERFDWSYRDKDRKYHRETGITPREFYDKYIGLDLDAFYTLVDCPTVQTPYERTFTIDLFDNMPGQRGWKWLNVPIYEIKKIALKILKNGEAVLFGCDVLQESHTKEGYLLTGLYNYDLLFQTSFIMDKKTRLECGHARLTHSMVLTGVELEGKTPVRWKVENSWGTDAGRKGYFVMSDRWFDEHVLDLIVPPRYMPAVLKKRFSRKPVILPPWHVMA